jgi:hypothetical protein
MDDKRSPWSAEPDAPGVLVAGTPPSSLTGGGALRTAQALHLAVDAARRDFPHTVREALQRQMTAALRVENLGAEQRALWDHVQALWRAVARGDAEAIRAAMDTRYAGWIADEPSPHDREAAVGLGIERGAVLHYELAPESIEIDDAGDIGLVRYGFVAVLAGEHGTRHVEAVRTDLYRKVGDGWRLRSTTGPRLA